MVIGRGPDRFHDTLAAYRPIQYAILMGNMIEITDSHKGLVRGVLGAVYTCNRQTGNRHDHKRKQPACSAFIRQLSRASTNTLV